jgi:hypothetical protein
MGLGESIKPHASRQATTGDRLRVDSAGSITAPAKKETEASSLSLLTYSVLGKKIVSLRTENNFALRSASSGIVPSLCAPYFGSALSPVDATVQLSRLVDEGGRDPTNFFGRLKAEKVGSPPLPPVLVV